MTEKKFVALTFDDGPTPGITDQVLDVLKENDIVASFFLIGQKITEQSEYLIRRAYDMGCSIENHSKTHPGMPELNDREILDGTDRAYHGRKTGVLPASVYQL